MTHSSPILGTAAHVTEHVAAISFVSAFEFVEQRFLEAFGHDFRSWPLLVFWGLGLILYLAGLVTAAVYRRRQRRRHRPILKIPLLPIVPATPAMRQRRAVTAMAVIAVVTIAASIAASIAIVRFGGPRSDG